MLTIFFMFCSSVLGGLLAGSLVLYFVSVDNEIKSVGSRL